MVINIGNRICQLYGRDRLRPRYASTPPTFNVGARALDKRYSFVIVFPIIFPTKTGSSQALKTQSRNNKH